MYIYIYIYIYICIHIIVYLHIQLICVRESQKVQCRSSTFSVTNRLSFGPDKSVDVPALIDRVRVPTPGTGSA